MKEIDDDNICFGTQKICLLRFLSLIILKTDLNRNTANTGQIDQRAKEYYDSRWVNLSVSYNFGSTKVKGSRNRPVGNEDAAKKLLHMERLDIQDNSLCKVCQLFEPCFNAKNRCWVDIMKAYGKENWDYPDPRCAFAPNMINDLRF